MADHDTLARTVTKAGIILLENGAETKRVEDTMQRLCFAYGASVVDTYATPTLLIVSFTLNGELVHNIKRVHIQKTDLSKIDAVNTLSRQACSGGLSIENLDTALDEIMERKPYSDAVKIAGAAVCTFGFALFFNGNLSDAILSGVIGVIVEAAVLLLGKLKVTGMINNILCGALLTSCALLASGFTDIHTDTVSISVLMLLVPGLAITNAIRDTVNGDLVSGMARGLEAVLVAISIAVGSGLAMMLMGGFHL